jgi:hypothetical protein
MRDLWSMSNPLKVGLQTTIFSLDDRRWSRRRIARELGIDRETVGRYLRLAKPAISTSGLEEVRDVKPTISTAGNGIGRKSQREPLAKVIIAKVELGLSAQGIYQDLVGEIRLYRFLPIGEALCAQTANGPARADPAFGIPTGRRTAAS